MTPPSITTPNVPDLKVPQEMLDQIRRSRERFTRAREGLGDAQGAFENSGSLQAQAGEELRAAEKELEESTRRVDELFRNQKPLK
jgi:hypothetical protein